MPQPFGYPLPGSTVRVTALVRSPRIGVDFHLAGPDLTRSSQSSRLPRQWSSVATQPYPDTGDQFRLGRATRLGRDAEIGDGMSTNLREGPARVSRPARAVTTAGALALTFASLVAVGAGPAYADTVSDTSITIDFTADGYDAAAEHAPQGQNGWRNGVPGVIDAGLRGDALRISNAATAPAISQVYAPSLAESAGEPATGAAYDQFTAQFSVASATGGFQPGLRLEVTPDNSTGARTGGTFVLHHNPATELLELGAFWSDEQADPAETVWHNAVLASLDPSEQHDVKLVHTFRVGQPDTVDVFVNGEFVRTVGTYEHYHDRWSNGAPFTINTLLFRASTSIPDATGRGLGEVQPAVPEVAGEGFLVSDISYGVSNAVEAPRGTSFDLDLAGPGYLSTSLGAPGKQNGWFRGFAELDNAIVDGRLRISNARDSGVQQQLIAPPLGAAAGHPELGAEHDAFEASFRIAAVDDEFQPGLRLEVAPDDGKGSRTGGSFIFHHNPATGMLEIGALWTDLARPLDGGVGNWISRVLASVDPTVPHDVTLRHSFVENGQDVVDVYVDGSYVGTTGTYEEFHRASGNEPRTISTLLFKSSQSVPSASGAGWDVQPPVPELEGRGFLVDQISYRVLEAAAPAAPADVTAALEGTNAVAVSWQASADEGSAKHAGYVVRLAGHGLHGHAQERRRCAADRLGGRGGDLAHVHRSACRELLRDAPRTQRRRAVRRVGAVGRDHGAVRRDDPPAGVLREPADLPHEGPRDGLGRRDRRGRRNRRRLQQEDQARLGEGDQLGRDAEAQGQAAGPQVQLGRRAVRRRRDAAPGRVGQGFELPGCAHGSGQADPGRRQEVQAQRPAAGHDPCGPLRQRPLGHRQAPHPRQRQGRTDRHAAGEGPGAGHGAAAEGEEGRQGQGRVRQDRDYQGVLVEGHAHRDALTGPPSGASGSTLGDVPEPVSLTC